CARPSVQRRTSTSMYERTLFSGNGRCSLRGMASMHAIPAPARVWVDDRHPVFRRGIASLLAADGFTVAGESAALDPVPDPRLLDVLLFEAIPSSFSRAVGSPRHAGVRFVAVLPVLRERLVYEALDAGVEAFLRAELGQPAASLDVSFALPDKEWAAGVTRPTLNLLLASVNPASSEAGVGIQDFDENGQRRRRAALPRMAFTYLVT